jgi:hypothetical protein
MSEPMNEYGGEDDSFSGGYNGGDYPSGYTIAGVLVVLFICAMLIFIALKVNDMHVKLIPPVIKAETDVSKFRGGRSNLTFRKQNVNLKSGMAASRGQNHLSFRSGLTNRSYNTNGSKPFMSDISNSLAGGGASLRGYQEGTQPGMGRGRTSGGQYAASEYFLGGGDSASLYSGGVSSSVSDERRGDLGTSRRSPDTFDGGPLARALKGR